MSSCTKKRWDARSNNDAPFKHALFVYLVAELLFNSMDTLDLACVDADDFALTTGIARVKIMQHPHCRLGTHKAQRCAHLGQHLSDDTCHQWADAKQNA